MTDRGGSGQRGWTGDRGAPPSQPEGRSRRCVRKAREVALYTAPRLLHCRGGAAGRAAVPPCTNPSHARGGRQRAGRVGSTAGLRPQTARQRSTALLGRGIIRSLSLVQRPRPARLRAGAGGHGHGDPAAHIATLRGVCPRALPPSRSRQAGRQPVRTCSAPPSVLLLGTRRCAAKEGGCMMVTGQRAAEQPSARAGGSKRATNLCMAGWLWSRALFFYSYEVKIMHATKASVGPKAAHPASLSGSTLGERRTTAAYEGIGR